jgi:hypothetical protein
MAKGARRGATRSLGPPEGEPWVWMTRTMLGSLTYRSLSISARRILDRLLYEHSSHGGRENGNLACPYRQLDQWGVTLDDARRGFEELIVAGYVERTFQGLRQDGAGDPSRYALTWLPTLVGTPQEHAPTHRWLAVNEHLSRNGHGNLKAARRWLKDQVAGVGRGTANKQRPTPHLRIVSPLKCGVKTP